MGLFIFGALDFCPKNKRTTADVITINYFPFFSDTQDRTWAYNFSTRTHFCPHLSRFCPFQSIPFKNATNTENIEVLLMPSKIPRILWPQTLRIGPTLNLSFNYLTIANPNPTRIGKEAIPILADNETSRATIPPGILIIWLKNFKI